ncbi:MAG: conjugal transfer protein TraC, partial [Patescibacteria group bacterium]
ASTNVDIKNRLIVFSIRDLEEELRPIAMYIVLNFVWNLIRSELRQRLLVIDEAWWMMKYKDSASFLFGLVKRARKYYLGVTTITQDVDDFIKSEYGRPIITNSSIQLLLKQSPTSIGSVAEAFDLTEGEKTFLLESGVGEGLFFAGMKHVAMRVIASYTEDQIITTNPEQMLEIKGLKE